VRISRGLEVYEQTGVPISALRSQATPPEAVHAHVVVLDPPLPELRRSIAERLDKMFASGLEDEVRALRAAGYGPALRPLQALGYAQVGALLDGACTRAAAIADTLAATVAYARRQRTWFRKEAAAARLPSVPLPDLADLVRAVPVELRLS
jgi:tRNA dimethylallyltransferase